MNAKYTLDEDMEKLEFHLYITGMDRESNKAVDEIMRKYTHEIMSLSK